MWRFFSSFSVALALSGTLIGGALAAPTTDPVAEQRFSESAEAAEASFDFDPWMENRENIEDRRRPVDVNLRVQEAGVGLAQADVDLALIVFEEAEADRIDAEAELKAQQVLLQAFAISGFLLYDGNLDPNPNAEVNARRREAPLETLTDDVIIGVKQATVEVNRTVEVETAAKQKLDDDQARLEVRTTARERAVDLVSQFDTLVEEWELAIATRTDEALNLNDQPELTRVRGFNVNVSLAPNLELLLAHAEADGIVLGGWGHRPVAMQLVLRESHCGDSGYALFDMPAGRCRPPTARPGHSEHELGLAIDFTENGTILNRNSPAFVWLKEHAAEYGLKNLPSEAWHWSTTGH